MIWVGVAFILGFAIGLMAMARGAAAVMETRDLRILQLTEGNNALQADAMHWRQLLEREQAVSAAHSRNLESAFHGWRGTEAKLASVLLTLEHAVRSGGLDEGLLLGAPEVKWRRSPDGEYHLRFADGEGARH